jgi:hypothetical protein
LADEGARKQEVNEIDMAQGRFIRDTGAKLRAILQSTLYHGIMSRKEGPTQKKAKRNIDLAVNLIEENTGKRVKETTIWNPCEMADAVAQQEPRHFAVRQ